MSRFGVLIVFLVVSFTVSRPSCKISFWISPTNVTCTTAPNGTYSSMVHNGSCTLSPDDPRRTSYQLFIDLKTRTVRNFTVFRDKTCAHVDELMAIKEPLRLNTCGSFYYAATSTSFVKIGSVLFSCRS